MNSTRTHDLQYACKQCLSLWFYLVGLTKHAAVSRHNLACMCAHQIGNMHRKGGKHDQHDGLVQRENFVEHLGLVGVPAPRH